MEGKKRYTSVGGGFPIRGNLHFSQIVSHILDLDQREFFSQLASHFTNIEVFED